MKKPDAQPFLGQKLSVLVAADLSADSDVVAMVFM